MKAFLRWLTRIIASAITIILVIVLFPYISRFAARILPDETGAAIKTSAILAQRLQNSARLETLEVEEEGVLNYDIQAAFIGTVGSINAQYLYEASFGVDLADITMQVTGKSIRFLLPQPELLRDSLTPSEVYRDDFWVAGFSDNDYEKLMEDERLTRRDAYLNGEYRAQLLDATVTAFENTVAAWMREIDANVTFEYEFIEESIEN